MNVRTMGLDELKKQLRSKKKHYLMILYFPNLLKLKRFNKINVTIIVKLFISEILYVKGVMVGVVEALSK